MNNKSGWQLLDDGPEAYEKYIVPAFSGAWATDIVERAGLLYNHRVLDLGCGTGIVSRNIHQSMGGSIKITGLDINEVVIKKASEISQSNDSTIEWRQGSVESLPFADEEFDVVLCQQGLQYFPDRLLALTEVNRVLAPRGHVVFSVWRSMEYNPFYFALHKALEQYVNAEAASILYSAYILGDSKQLRELFESADFCNIEISIVIKQMCCPSLAEFLLGGISASPFANDIFQLKDSKREEMFQSIHDSISDYIDDHGLVAPMESYIISAKK